MSASVDLCILTLSFIASFISSLCFGNADVSHVPRFPFYEKTRKIKSFKMISSNCDNN